MSLLLMSPLGQGLAELTRDASGARLVQPNQPVIVADSTLPQLAQQHFLHPLPLDADGRLAAWRTAGPGWRSRWLARRNHRNFAVSGSADSCG
jgi:outer membrane biogenesis lipoprotein LolB